MVELIIYTITYIVRDMELRRNNHSVSSLQYHIVITPKYRKSMLVDGVDSRFKEILFYLAKEKDWCIVELEVMPDHVHILIEAAPKWSVSQIIKFIKGRSSFYLRKEFPVLKEIVTKKLWTSSFFVCSVGGSNEDVVKRYIENQKKERI